MGQGGRNGSRAKLFHDMQAPFVLHQNHIEILLRNVKNCE